MIKWIKKNAFIFINLKYRLFSLRALCHSDWVTHLPSYFHSTHCPLANLYSNRSFLLVKFEFEWMSPVYPPKMKEYCIYSSDTLNTCRTEFFFQDFQVTKFINTKKLTKYKHALFMDYGRMMIAWCRGKPRCKCSKMKRYFKIFSFLYCKPTFIHGDFNSQIYGDTLVRCD